MEQAQPEDLEYQKLKESKFKQQKLPAWRPVPTVMSTFITFISFGIIFITLGIIIVIFSNQIVESVTQYDNQCGAATLGSICSLTITINQVLTPPVIVFYQLDNFYQNHRRYVKSKSDGQLNGGVLQVSQISSECDPIVTNANLGLALSANQHPLDLNAAANPCGLIAKSFFNDTYTMFDQNTVKVPIDETNIAWDSDIQLKYKRPPGNSALAGTTGSPDDFQWIDNTNEHFIVWMRPAGLPNFRKLWGRIQQTINPGTYTVNVKNNYPVSDFQGKKLFVLSTVNAFGGKNNFLGISYLVVGGLCIIIAFLFLFGYKANSSKKNT